MSKKRDAHDVIRAPAITEKSTLVSEHNQVVFKVVRDASKDEIKKAVEHLFSVEVDQVRVVNSKGKVKRFGQMLGRRSHSKKAYVKLKPGFDIEFAGAQ